ncbi:MAG TPA: TrmH family RNA methyltransferase [Nannocystaceae bacterium]|nr:TrmH family RNA methyltransferase [Nannocystaceae bacterium]
MNAGESGERRRFRARTCSAADCGLRFPVDCDADGTSTLGRTCPLCGAPTLPCDPPYSTDEAPRPEHGARPRCELAALLDNIRSLRNVGSIVRAADGVGLGRIVFAGITPTPDHPGLAKTALGAERCVPWSRGADAVRAAAELVAEGWALWALEGGARATSIFDPQIASASAGARVCLVVGHEVSGIDPRVLALCERVLFIPMLGHKGSLNVAVAFGIAAYVLRFGG